MQQHEEDIIESLRPNLFVEQSAAFVHGHIGQDQSHEYGICFV